MLVFSARLGSRSGSEGAYDLLRFAYKSYNYDDMPEIKKTPNGKPYFPDRSGVHFSLSHSRSHALCAISSMPVGCDIESEDRKISIRAMRFFCTAEELEHFTPLDLWILKESYIKLFGLTFADLRRQYFSLESTAIILPDSSVSSKIYSIDGCRAAICSLSGSLPDSITQVCLQ